MTLKWPPAVINEMKYYYQNETSQNRKPSERPNRLTSGGRGRGGGGEGGGGRNAGSGEGLLQVRRAGIIGDACVRHQGVSTRDSVSRGTFKKVVSFKRCKICEVCTVPPPPPAKFRLLFACMLLYRGPCQEPADRWGQQSAIVCRPTL